MPLYAKKSGSYHSAVTFPNSADEIQYRDLSFLMLYHGGMMTVSLLQFKSKGYNLIQHFLTNAITLILHKPGKSTIRL